MSLRVASRIICLALFLAFVGAAGLPALAQPPTNDVCSGAEVIPASAFPVWTSIKDISEATTNGDPPLASCSFGNAFSHSIWYSFTPIDSAFYTISSCADGPTATSVPDTFMAIYTSSAGCGGVLTEVPSSGMSSGCADDSCGPGFTQAAITTQLSADTSYYIVVWQSDVNPPPAGSTSVQLRVSKTTPPTNDTGAGAIAVSLNLPVIGSTILAHNDYQLASDATCFTNYLQIGNTHTSTAAGRDVVYSFTAPAAGNYSIKVDRYNNISADLVLYAASTVPSGPAPATVTNCLYAANRNPATSAEEILCLPMAASQKIYIFVDEDTLSPGGSRFVLEVTQCNRETEPDNTWPTANLFKNGIEGSISPASDADYYALGAPLADWRVFAMVDGSAANVTSLQMRILGISSTSSNVLEFDNGNNDDLFGSLSSNVGGTPLNGAPAYLRINGNGSSVVEPYRLYAVVQPPLASATLETEPNNSQVQPNPVAANNYYYGSLAGPAPSTDVDVFAFSVEAVDGVSDLIFLSLDCDPLRNNTPINAKLELLDEAGNVLVSVDDGLVSSSTTSIANSLTATTPFSPAEALVFRTFVDGTYYARVSISPNANLGNGAGDYLLSISRNGYAGSCGCNTAPTLAGVAAPPMMQNGAATLSATVNDPDAAQTHQVTVNWGDGSAITITNLAAWITSVSLSHTYSDSSKDYHALVTISDSAGGSSTTNVTIPRVPPPHLQMLLPWVSGDVKLKFQGTPFTAYTIQTSAALTGWTNFLTRTTDVNGFFPVEDTASPSPASRFYRAIKP